MTSSPKQIYVFDGLLRLIHAWNGLAIVALIATGLSAESYRHSAQAAALWQLHVQFGYLLVGGLAARLLWGLLGPDSARWSDLWHPREWLSALRSLPRVHRPAPRRGHDQLASAVFIALYLTLAGMIATGLALAAIKHDMGPLAVWLGDSAWLKPLFKEPHEFLHILVIGFVPLHLAALIWHQVFGAAPLAQAMLNGKQYQAGDENPAESHVYSTPRELPSATRLPGNSTR